MSSVEGHAQMSEIVMVGPRRRGSPADEEYKAMKGFLFDGQYFKLN